MKQLKKANEGYVYILTHPCFKENIVKIGKTQGAVEDRAKQLFTTALPKEFSIYATLRTSKFSETEELIHAYFNAQRISPNREFFNISPADALAVFYKVKRILSDGEISEDFKRKKVFEVEDANDKKKDKGLSDRQKYVLRFWTEFNKFAEKYKPFIEAPFNLRKPLKYSYYDFAINRGTYHVFMRVTSQKGNILSGIYVRNDKATYDRFLSQRDDIEGFVGKKLEWNWATQDGAFSLVKEFDIKAPTAALSEAFKWLCDTAILFKQVDEKFGLPRE